MSQSAHPLAQPAYEQLPPEQAADWLCSVSHATPQTPQFCAVVAEPQGDPASASGDPVEVRTSVFSTSSTPDSTDESAELATAPPSACASSRSPGSTATLRSPARASNAVGPESTIPVDGEPPFDASGPMAPQLAQFEYWSRFVTCAHAIAPTARKVPVRRSRTAARMTRDYDRPPRPESRLRSVARRSSTPASHIGGQREDQLARIGGG